MRAVVSPGREKPLGLEKPLLAGYIAYEFTIEIKNFFVIFLFRRYNWY